MSLNRLRQVAENATDGPWHVYDRGVGFHIVTDPDDPHRTQLPDGFRTDLGRVEDAAHIATFDPPTVKALLDVAEAAEGVEFLNQCQCIWSGDTGKLPTRGSQCIVCRLQGALARLRGGGVVTRCEAFHEPIGGSSLLRCRREPGHDGRHKAAFGTVNIAGTTQTVLRTWDDDHPQHRNYDQALSWVERGEA